MEFVRSQQYIKSLTGLRGIAAFIVVLAHFSSESHWFGGVLGSGAGQLGVIIFYVLSSWLMMHLYHGEDSPTLSVRLLNSASFLWNRFSRIFPLYLSILIISFLLGFIVPWLNLYQVHMDNLWEILSFREAYSVSWSIGPEILFYVLFAGLLLLPSRLRVIIVALLSVGSLTLYLKPDLNWIEAFGFQWGKLTGNYHVYKIFVAGCLLNLIHRSMVFNVGRDVGIVLSLLVPAALVFCYPKISLALFDVSPRRYGWDDWGVLILVVALLTLSINVDPLRWVLSTRPLVFLGEISFSVYISHYMILNAMIAGGLLAPNAFSFILACALCLALAFALYTAIERPSRRLLRALPERIGGRPGRNAIVPPSRSAT